MPTFYDCTPAPSPRRARIVLAEKGIAHAVKIVDLSKAEQLTPEFRAINPACTVPVLVLAATLIFRFNWSVIKTLPVAALGGLALSTLTGF